MAKTLISIKADKEVKENAQKLARELGLSLSDVMNAALRNFIRTRKATFSSIPYMTPELERLLGVVEEDIKAGRNMSPTLSSAEEVSAYLDDL
jgi:addiction module RelB/DinJ family antitoxin